MIQENIAHIFWLRLVALSDDVSRGKMSIEQLGDMLAGIEEGYGGFFDPADSYNEYVVWQLLVSIRRVLIENLESRQ